MCTSAITLYVNILELLSFVHYDLVFRSLHCISFRLKPHMGQLIQARSNRLSDHDQ